MAEPNDWQDEPADWVDAPEGGAEGGAPDAAPLKSLAHAAVPTHKDLSEEKQKVADTMTSLAHGQGAPLDEQEDRSNRQVAGALGEGIAMARGTPLVGSHIDELSALLQAHAASGPDYEKKRNEARKAVDEAVSRNPVLPTAGALAFAPALPSTMAGRLGLSAAEGASEGVGAAKNMSEAPRAALVGGATGLGTGLVGEAGIQGGKYFGGKQADVLAKNAATVDKGIDKSVRSAIGTVGQKEAEAAQALRVLEERANATTGDPAVRAAAKQALESDYANQLRDQIARGYMRRWEGLGPSIGNARDEMTNVLATATPEARAAAAEARLNDSSAMIRRIREMGPKIALPTLGAFLAGPAGAGAGAGMSAVLGRSGTTARNLLADPYVASRVLGLGEGALGGAGRAVTSEAPNVSRSLLDVLRPKDEKPEEPWQRLAGSP